MELIQSSFKPVTRRAGLVALLIAAATFAQLGDAISGFGSDTQATDSYIVQASSLAEARHLALEAGAAITHELGIINAVAVELSVEERARLQIVDGVRVLSDAEVTTAGNGGKPDKSTSSDPATGYALFTEASQLHSQGITGFGVTVAVLDTGSMSHVSLNKDSWGGWRYLAQYDAIAGELLSEVNMAHLGTKRGGTGIYNIDGSGHGTHVASIAVSSAKGDDGHYNGIAPNAYLVNVKAFDDQGQGSYADVIRGIDWVVANRNKFGIRVLNLSLSAQPQSHYWEDPLNQAVMRAWDAGIVVVASAGNTGPGAQTIGVPGNVPYVITVGAITDNYSPDAGHDDRLASFSAVGPTYEGFVKPEVVAPGGHILGLMNNSTAIGTAHPEFHDGGAYFTMSGTSQAAAVVTGVVALMLNAEPALTPDMVKCKLMNSARPAVNSDGSLAYSVFQQGAGMINAYDAVYNWNYHCANRGLDIAKDLSGEQHYGGRANQAADGSYYLMGLDGYTWTDDYSQTDGYIWTDGFVWTDGYIWTDAYLWTDGTTGVDGYLWTDGYVWTDGYIWTDGFIWTDGYIWTDALTETMSINFWVPQE